MQEHEESWRVNNSESLVKQGSDIVVTGGTSDEDNVKHIVELANDFATALERAELEANMLGGMAVYLICPSVREGPLARRYHDLDAIVDNKAVIPFEQLVVHLGFVPDRSFNVLYGDKRLLYRRGSIEMDVFVDTFEQCHKLDVKGRLRPKQPTLSPADLLLTKLQIVEINRKDLTDSIAILLDHPLSEDDKNLNIRRIIDVTSSDWGWYTTVCDNLAKVTQMATELLAPDQAQYVTDKIQTILGAIQQHPKSMKWKIRARIGRRIPWYVIPDEK